MRVFVDTNVLVSAVATRGLCADVLREILASHDMIISQQVLDEVEEVLRSRFGAGPDAVAEFVQLLRHESIIAKPGPLPDVELQDKDDLPVLAAAVASRAQVMVTGDQELLELGAVENVEIISPRQFWEKLKTARRRTTKRTAKRAKNPKHRH